MSFLLYDNSQQIFAGTINLQGIDSTGAAAAPIVTSSTVLCQNVYVHRAEICDNCGNISTNLTVAGNAEIDGWLDVDGNVSTGDLNVVGNVNVSGWIDVIGNIDTADSINAANANINGDALINGNLTVGGWISATGNIDTADCINAACANISQNVIIGGDLTVTGSFSGGGSSITGSLALSSADILSIGSLGGGTQFPIIAAPGAGKYIVMEHLSIVFTYNSIAYINGGTISQVYNNAGAGVSGPDLCTAATINGTASVIAYTLPGGGDIFPILNKGIALSQPGGYFTTGNSTAVLHFKYYIVTV